MTSRLRWPGSLVLLVGALLLLITTLVVPAVPLSRSAHDILVVIDITGSMNTRDMRLSGRTVSRLEAAREVVSDAIALLPCESRVGLAVFSERRPFLLFEPTALCTSFPAVDGAIAALDWRMAWEGDSRIAGGLDHAILLAAQQGAGLVFVTDGHEAPPLPNGRLPDFESHPGMVAGLIVGAGGEALSPIPKFDREGHEIGFWGPNDVPHESRIGPPPENAQQREGWHPRNAPYGAAAVAGTEHLSSRRDDYLRTLAAATGLTSVTLDTADMLATAIRATIPPRPVPSSLDVRPALAGLALVLLLAAHGADLARRRRLPDRRATAVLG